MNETLTATQVNALTDTQINTCEPRQFTPWDARLKRLYAFTRERINADGLHARIIVEADEFENILEIAMESSATIGMVRAIFRRHGEGLEKYSQALADVNCWLGGYESSGKTYEPGTRHTLQDLRRVIDRLGELL